MGSKVMAKIIQGGQCFEPRLLQSLEHSESRVTELEPPPGRPIHFPGGKFCLLGMGLLKRLWGPA